MEMETVLERQHQLEQEEVKRLAHRREEEYVARFVCGKSYDEAAESCDAVAASPMDVVAAATTSAVYCPTGSSMQCPTDMQCYAAVSCPRLTHDEEPPLRQEISLGLELLLKSFLVTEPILLNATDNNIRMVNDEGGKNDSGTTRLAQEEWMHHPPSEWNSLFLESSSAVLATVSALLSPRYGLN